MCHPHQSAEKVVKKVVNYEKSRTFQHEFKTPKNTILVLKNPSFPKFNPRFARAHIYLLFIFFVQLDKNFKNCNSSAKKPDFFKILFPFFLGLCILRKEFIYNIYFFFRFSQFVELTNKYELETSKNAILLLQNPIF